MDRITEKQFYRLLSRKLSAEATSEELALLQEQLLFDPQWRFLHDQMMKPTGSAISEEQTQQAWAVHLVKMQLQGNFEDSNVQVSDLSIKKSIHRKRFRYVASLLAAACLIVLIFISEFNLLWFKKSSEVQGIITPKGSRSTVTLPDGTKVWLNGDSRLSYMDFNGNTREVEFSGEGFFDVAHNPDRPFIIHSGGTKIKVLGTAFNVRNYPEDKAVETTLMRGKIEVSFDDHPEKKIFLNPMEKLVAAKTIGSDSSKANVGNNLVLTAVEFTNSDSLVAETSWLKGKWVFTNQLLENIAMDMERRYDIKVVFKTKTAANYRYTGNFETETVERILKILKMSKNFNYTIEGKTVFIE